VNETPKTYLEKLSSHSSCFNLLVQWSLRVRICLLLSSSVGEIGLAKSIHMW